MWTGATSGFTIAGLPGGWRLKIESAMQVERVVAQWPSFMTALVGFLRLLDFYE